MKLEEKEKDKLKLRLDLILANPDLKNHAKNRDPIGLVYPYKYKEDQEAVAFITSTLSYGRQTSFRPVISKILDLLGERPVTFLVESSAQEWQENLEYFKYRFNDKQDLLDLLLVLQRLYREGKTLESVFKIHFEGDIKEAASKFITELWGSLETRSKGFQYLLPHPERGSACKRLNMFFRWMIRQDAIDLGTWAGLPQECLIIPLDTHIAKASLLLGLTNRKEASWKTAEDITDSLRQLDSKDPVKYDFSLCTAGILGTL